MLAQIKEIDGVREARVDWTGRRFLLELNRSARAEHVVAAVADLLGPTTRRLPPAEEQKELATFIAGAPWLRSSETARMSAHEAQVLATRYATDAAMSVGLDNEGTSRLTKLVQEELETLFKKFAVSGMPSRAAMAVEWGAVVERVADRSREFLTTEERDRVAALMKECLSE